MIEIDYFTFQIKIQNDAVKSCNSFSKLVCKYLSFNINNKEDPRNFIKKCPYCEIIWYKVEGCDGKTTCGEEITEKNQYDFVSDSKYFYKYSFEIIKNKLIMEKKQKSNFFKENHINNKKNNKTNKKNKRGCGREIIWKDLPKLDDKVIFELYNVKSITEIKDLIENPKFRESIREIENKTDKKIHDENCKCTICTKEII